MNNRHDAFNSNTATLEPPAPLVAATTAPAKPKGLKKLSFGTLTVKKEETKTAYPVYHNPEAALIAARIKTRTVELEALSGALATDKAELKQSVGLFYFNTSRGKSAVPSSISVPSAEGEVLVTFQNRYSKLEDDSGITAILGDRVEACFRQQDTITIHCDKLAADAAQQFVDDLNQLLARYQAGDAVEIKSSIKPVADFHAKRHTLLTVEENMALEGVCPIIAMIKTKGRGEQ